MLENIVEEVRYYVNDPNATKNDVAVIFHRSLSSKKKDFAKFRGYVEECIANGRECCYIDLYNAEQRKSLMNENQGRKKGSLSTNSGRSKSLDIADIIKICKYIITNQATLSEAYEEFGIPTSTLYENIESLKESNDEEIRHIYFNVKRVYEANRRNIVIDDRGSHK